MTLKQSLQFLLILILAVLFASSLSAQKTSDTKLAATDFSDRQAILTTIENFYIGDHTGSVKHKRLSMHPKGAYRSVNRDGEYGESTFNLDSDHADPNFKEELQSVEIYGTMALAKLRLQLFGREAPEYKLMILHKTDGEWKITTMVWGFGIKY